MTKKAFELSKRGLKVTEIISELKIGTSTYYASEDLKSAVNRGRNASRLALLKKLEKEGSSSSLKFLYNQLPNEYEIPKIKSAKQATKVLAMVAKDFTQGIITKEQAETTARVVSMFLKAHQTNELEERLCSLEAVLKNLKQ